MNKERKDKHFLHKPYYEGGTEAIKRLIAENIQYPEPALAEGVEGTVHLRYDINHRGIVTGAKIISGVGYGCDEEAIRLVKLLKFQVAKNRGVKAIFHKTIRIHFRRPKQQKKAPTPNPPTNIQYNYTTKVTSKNHSTDNSAPEKTSYTYTIHIKP